MPAEFTTELCSKSQQSAAVVVLVQLSSADGIHGLSAVPTRRPCFSRPYRNLNASVCCSAIVIFVLFSRMLGSTSDEPAM
jgi:hypothetical protein